MRLENTILGKVAMVVSLLVAISTSQGMVLCIGAHGHMAIEPAGHHHCASIAHTHDDVGADHHESVVSELDHEHCEPCVDIPLSCEDRLVSKTAQTRVSLSVTEGPAASPTDSLSVGVYSCHFLPVCHTPLRTVILQV